MILWTSISWRVRQRWKWELTSRKGTPKYSSLNKWKFLSLCLSLPPSLPPTPHKTIGKYVGHPARCTAEHQEVQGTICSLWLPSLVPRLLVQTHHLPASREQGAEFRADLAQGMTWSHTHHFCPLPLPWTKMATRSCKTRVRRPSQGLAPWAQLKPQWQRWFCY